MRKKAFGVLFLCALLCALTACGKGAGDAVPPQADAAPPEVSTAEPAVPASPPAPETDDAAPLPPVQGEEPSIPASGWTGALAAYEEILNELYQTYEDPERFRYEDGPSFSLYDVDRDGSDELIARDPVGEVSGQWVRIYGYDEAAGEAVLELEEYSSLYYYDNGVIEAAWSHNQGAAGDRLWPYNVYQYDPGAGVYVRLAAVDGWDKELREVWEGEAFPDGLDQDGDGFLYYVISEPGGYAPVYGEAMDQAAYDAWREVYLQGAAPCGPSFVPLTKENISLR